jgi:hypothetical protein
MPWRRCRRPAAPNLSLEFEILSSPQVAGNVPMPALWDRFRLVRTKPTTASAKTIEPIETPAMVPGWSDALELLI